MEIMPRQATISLFCFFFFSLSSFFSLSFFHLRIWTRVTLLSTGRKRRKLFLAVLGTKVWYQYHSFHVCSFSKLFNQLSATPLNTLSVISSFFFFIPSFLQKKLSKNRKREGKEEEERHTFSSRYDHNFFQVHLSPFFLHLSYFLSLFHSVQEKIREGKRERMEGKKL